MPPGVGPGAVRGHITDGTPGRRGFIRDGLAIVDRQQVLPGRISIGVIDCVGSRPYCTGGVGVFLMGANVARVVIAPGPGLARFLVVLTGELVGGVVDVGGGIRAVGNTEDVAVIVVGVGVVPGGASGGDGMLGDLRTGGGESVPIRLHQGRAVLGLLLAVSAQGIVGVVPDRCRSGVIGVIG